MTLAGIIGIIGGIFKFWDEVTWLIQTLQKTPAEEQQDLVQSIQKEAQNYAKTGRPTWS